MKKDIKTVTVFGAGTMGAGIASLFANIGIKVHLLDIDIPNKETGETIPGETFVAQRIEEMKKASKNPAADPLNGTLLAPQNAKNLIPGSSIRDLEKTVGESDLIIEAIPEVLAWKQGLFATFPGA